MFFSTKLEILKAFEEPQNIQLLLKHEKLVNNEKYSDFKIICSDNEVIHAMKGILAIHCDFYEAMFNSNLKEAVENEVRVEDIDSETMLEFVRFVYCRKVNDIENVNDRLLLAANKYGLQELEELCVDSMMNCSTPDNVLEFLRIADMTNISTLRENCIDFIKL